MRKGLLCFVWLLDCGSNQVDDDICIMEVKFCLWVTAGGCPAGTRQTVQKALKKIATGGGEGAPDLIKRHH